MAVTSSKIVRLTFSTAGGKTYTITVPNPKAGLVKTTIAAVMQTVIDANIDLQQCADAHKGYKGYRYDDRRPL